MSSRFWTIALPLVLLLVVGIVLLDRAFPGALAAPESQMRLAYALGLLALVGGSLVMGWRRQPTLALQHAAIWGGIFVGLLVIYAYRVELGNVAARVGLEVVPSRPISDATGVVRIGTGSDGHFNVSASVEGIPVQFLVDTGASLVALTPNDARRIGIDLDALDYNIPMGTANGTTFGAAITLNEISIGDIRVRNIAATVLQGGLDTSLLGMSFLRRLDGYEVDQNQLILRQ